MTILQQPDILSLSGNIKEFRISSSEPISFSLLQGGVEIITQSYTPGKDGSVTINLRDIVHSRLSFTLQESALVYEQPSLAATFTAVISGTEVSFRVIRSGVDRLADTATNFLTQNFLTWQPSIKAVTYYSPEFLTYYAVVTCTAKLRAYFTNDSGVVTSQQDITLYDFDAGKAYTIPLQYASVAEKLGNKLPAYYDVWTESPTGNRLTYIQRYYASDMLSEQEQWILFENSLGGIDTFRAYGSTDFTGDHTHNIAEIDEVSTEYRIDTTRKFQKNTGHLKAKERQWLLDFFPSQAKYIYAGTYLRSIVVIESNVTYTDRDLPSNYTFTYKYADARPLLNLPRIDIPSEALHITVPSVGSFTVPPRLVEFPRLPLTEGALFPVQNPYSEEWGTATAGSIGDFIAERLSENYNGEGGVGHNHKNIDLLNLLSYIDEYLLVAGKKIKSGKSDESDITRLLRSTNFIPGIIGAIIDQFGDGEMGSLVLRKFLSVPELRFNRAIVYKGKQIISPGGGCLVESFILNGDGTWTIVPKLEQGEPLSQEIDDILLAYWHDKDVQTGAFKGFREMKFRVTSVDYASKTFVIVPKPDSLSIPAIAMTLAQVGNFTNTERQTYIMIDSTLGNNNITFFDDCNTWDVEEHQEKSWFGKKKGRKVAGIDASAYSAILKHIIMIGLIFQIDEISGDMVRVPCDKGAHVPKQRYAYYDRVSSAGALWLCVNEKGTSDTPTDGNEDWLKQVDKGADGKPGADGIGIPGADGVTYYTWMRYADDEQGNGMSNNPMGKSYMGLAYNKLTAVESSNPADYTWSRFRGEDGKDGTDGIGTPGADGITYYTWLAYSDNADGSNMYQIPTDNTLYVGIAINKPTADESSNPADYTWSRFRGTDGKPGTSITNHGAWRTAKTPIPKMGLVTMGGSSWLAKVETSNPPMWCLTDGVGNRLISGSGYLLTGEINSAEWELLVESGADGKPGADGIGIPGADGVTYYTWMRYADDVQGNGMSNNPIGKSYMGLAYNKLTAVESSNPADYTWSRFRGEDGKDGTDGIGTPGADGITYYTWLAYSDNADGSNMYQIPTDNTLYVGIAINKPTATESSNPADYTWSRFRGTDGKPGTSITNHGAWRTAKTPIPKMGLVTMGGSSWLAKVETSNPPMWCLTDGAGNRLMSGSGYLLTGEINSEEWELIVESGVDGKPGADGSDSTSYWLTSPISTININSIGSLSPSSVLISCKKKKGEGTVTACSDFYLAARKYNGSWLAHVSPVKASTLSLPGVAGYTQFAVRAYNSAAEADAWGSSFVSEIGVGVVVDGSAGNDGPAGSFPRELGVFVDGTSYVWNPSYRDSILYPFDGVYYKFHVANFGATVTAAPTSASGDGLWESMGKYKSIATDTLFADGANVARFMFKNGVLRSQDETDGVPNLELNGKTGKFKGIDVELSGKIEAKEDSQIAGMKVVGNSLRGVQAIMGIYMRQITGNGSAADRDIIVNNIVQQQTYIFSITTAAQDVQVNLPSHNDMVTKGISEYQFEITIVLDKGSVGSAILFKCNDNAMIVHGLKTFTRYGLGSGGVLKLFYFQNRYYLISSSEAQTSPW